MRREREELAAAAEYICVRLYPEKIRAQYVFYIRHQFGGADAITLVLQELCNGTTSIIYGLLAAYLYDRVKKPDPKLIDIERALHRLREQVAQLSESIAKKPNSRKVGEARIAVEFYEITIRQIQDRDPSIDAKLRDAVDRLETGGAETLIKEVDAAGNLPSDWGQIQRWWFPSE